MTGEEVAALKRVEITMAVFFDACATFMSGGTDAAFHAATNEVNAAIDVLRSSI